MHEVRKVTVKMQVNGGDTSSLNKINRKLDKTTKNSYKAEKSANRLSRVYRNLAIGTPIALGITNLVRQTIRLEEKFADVKKVLPSTLEKEAIQDVKNEIVDMGREIPVATEKLMDMSAALLQSGVDLKNLREGVELASQLQVAFDATEQEAGEFVGKMPVLFSKAFEEMNLSAMEGTRLLGDYINYASNNFSAKAGEIMSIIKRIGDGGTRLGFDVKDQVALSTFMIASGTEAERASTALLSLFELLQNPLKANPKFQEALASIGLTGEEVFKLNKSQGPMKALETIFDGISKLEEIKRPLVLEAFFGTGLQASNVNKIVSNFQGEVQKVRNTLNNPQDVQGSLLDEYNSKVDTAAANIQKMKNEWSALANELSTTVLPVLNGLLRVTTDIIKAISDGVNNIKNSGFGKIFSWLGKRSDKISDEAWGRIEAGESTFYNERKAKKRADFIKSHPEPIFKTSNFDDMKRQIQDRLSSAQNTYNNQKSSKSVVINSNFNATFNGGDEANIQEMFSKHNQQLATQMSNIN